MSPDPNSSPCPWLPQGWGWLRRNKTPPASGRCLDTSDGIRKELLPELFLALHLLRAGNGPSQTLPAAWRNPGWDRLEVLGCALTLPWQGFCFWIPGEAGSSIFRSAPAFRSCFSPVLSLCHVLHLLGPHPCRKCGCGGLRVAGMAFPCTAQLEPGWWVLVRARRVLPSINKAPVFFRRAVGVPSTDPRG